MPETVFVDLNNLADLESYKYQNYGYIQHSKERIKFKCQVSPWNAPPNP